MSGQNINCGYTLGCSNEYTQSMLWIKNKKTSYTPAAPVLLYKTGVCVVFTAQTCVPDVVM